MIEIGIVNSVPEMSIRDESRKLCLGRCKVPGFTDQFVVFIKDLCPDLKAFCCAGNERPEGDFSTTVRKVRINIDAVGTIFIQTEAARWNTDQPDIAVETAVEGKVSPLGIDFVIKCIVCQDGQKVFALFHLPGNIRTESTVTAHVFRDLFSVQPDFTAKSAGTDFHIGAAFFGGLRGSFKGSHIPVRTAAERNTDHTIDCIPGMGQSDLFPVLIRGRKGNGQIGQRIAEHPGLAGKIN